MKVGFAVDDDEGLDSTIYSHFSSAPALIIIDTEMMQILGFDNRGSHHEHGACNPMMALEGNKPDAMVVGRIGRGELFALNKMGIKVFGAGAITVKQNIALLQDNRLKELLISDPCKPYSG
jgi:predicted Fe-Mo cluster-binding NifX family protein